MLQELEHRQRMDQEEQACDPGHKFLTNFTEQADAAAKRLKENVPGSVCPALAIVNSPSPIIAAPPRTAIQPAPAAEHAAPRGTPRNGRAAPYAERRPRLDDRDRRDARDDHRDYDDKRGSGYGRRQDRNRRGGW